MQCNAETSDSDVRERLDGQGKPLSQEVRFTLSSARQETAIQWEQRASQLQAFVSITAFDPSSQFSLELCN